VGGPRDMGAEEGRPVVLSVKREAAEQLIVNHEAVARFCCRALGSPGMPPVAAPLADPNANPNSAYIPIIDAALR
jgi:hypothetical protein